MKKPAPKKAAKPAEVITNYDWKSAAVDHTLINEIALGLKTASGGRIERTGLAIVMATAHFGPLPLDLAKLKKASAQVALAEVARIAKAVTVQGKMTAGFKSDFAKKVGA